MIRVPRGGEELAQPVRPALAERRAVAADDDLLLSCFSCFRGEGGRKAARVRKTLKKNRSSVRCPRR